MDPIRGFLAKYRISTHTVAVALAFLISAYYGNSTVQHNFDQAYAALPSGLKWIVGTIVALFMWYRNPATSLTQNSSPASSRVRTRGTMLLLLLPALAIAMSLTACSPSTLNTIEAYVNLILPAVETAANIVIQTEAPDGAALAQAVESKVNAGLRQIETLVSTLAGANAPAVRQ